MSAGCSRQEFSVDVTINSNRLRDHEYLTEIDVFQVSAATAH